MTKLRALEAQRWKDMETAHAKRMETKAKEDLKKVQEYKDMVTNIASKLVIKEDFAVTWAAAAKIRLDKRTK